jgi:uncharacterized membrane protein YuzA (DUF378 family)
MSATSRPTTYRSTRYGETAAQKAAIAFGIVFLLVGIAGFIPGLTTNLDTMQFAGPESGALLFGLFQVSILHNIVHILYGLAGLGLATTHVAARNYLIWGGAVYALLWLYGLIVADDAAANFVPLNFADDWLHFVLAAAMILLGVFLGRRDTTSARPTV